MSPKGEERRRAPRFERRLTLRTLSGSQELVELESSNIGPGGAYCISPRRLEEMTRLEVLVFLPDVSREGGRLHFPLRLESVVVRSELGTDGLHHVALFFPHVTPDQRELLERCLPEAGNAVS